ncbi:MAG: hypothetical protein ABH986_04985 [archaeon]
MYHSNETLREFSYSLISLSKKYKFNLILILIEEESDRQLIAFLSSMVDKVIS